MARLLALALLAGGLVLGSAGRAYAATGTVTVGVAVDGGGSVAGLVAVLVIPASTLQPLPLADAMRWSLGREDPNGVYRASREEGDYLVAVADLQAPGGTQPVLKVPAVTETVRIDGPLGPFQAPAVRAHVTAGADIRVGLMLTAESAVALRAKPRLTPVATGSAAQGTLAVRVTDDAGQVFGNVQPAVVVVPADSSQPLSYDDYSLRWAETRPATPPGPDVHFDVRRAAGAYLVALSDPDLTMSPTPADSLGITTQAGVVRRIPAVRAQVVAGQETSVTIRLSAESSAAVRARVLPTPTVGLPSVGEGQGRWGGWTDLLALGVAMLGAGVLLLRLASRPGRRWPALKGKARASTSETSFSTARAASRTTLSG